MGVVACCNSSVLGRQQTEVPRVNVLLDPPFRPNDEVGPELFAAQSSHGQVEIGLWRGIWIRIGRVHRSHGRLLSEDLGERSGCNDPKESESGRADGEMRFH